MLVCYHLCARKITAPSTPHMSLRLPLAAVFLSALAACSNAPVQPPSAGHLSGETPPPAAAPKIPAPVQTIATLPPPKAAAKTETYSVVVNNIRAQDLLFALARDAKINVDVHPGIAGTVTMNAIDQTLPQLLNRISRQIDMRWELDGPNLSVMPDSPFLRTYKVDYVNMSRDVSGAVSINTQIASTSSAATAGASGTSSVEGNNSTTAVKSSAQNHFWDVLEKNIKDILRETDKILPEGSSETVVERVDQQSTTGTGSQTHNAGGGRSNASQPNIAGSPNPATLQQAGTTVVRRTTFREAASVIVNSEAGVVVVRASSRQHEKIQEYLDLVTGNFKSQGVIEATLAEVTLYEGYKQGNNWQNPRTLRKPPGSAGFFVAQNPTGNPVPDPFNAQATTFLLNHVAPGLGISSTISLLETFGTVKVLSSPKISVLNNQTALLKVVNNIVYFHVEANTTTTQGAQTTAVTTTPQSVSVGLVMSVTPQISENDVVLLNVRPTISSTFGPGKIDPNPSIPAGIQNIVPEIQTREMESMLRLSNGEVAVMGGLMEDKIDYTTNAVPLLGSLPIIGNFFRNRDDTNTKTELVIFLRPIVIRDPSMNGDYRNLRSQLPDRDFFVPPARQRPLTGDSAQ